MISNAFELFYPPPAKTYFWPVFDFNVLRVSGLFGRLLLLEGTMVHEIIT